MKSKKKVAKARRFRKAREDAEVASVTTTIERIMGLPSGSVALITPSGRKKRGDASIQSLKVDWE